ncbi:MAG: GNAT family N-acetyltransferase [Haloferacaceae archaeon]
MEFVLLGWPEAGPTLRLDYRRFAYAGKFVMSNTGKAVVRDPNASDGHSGSDDPREERDDTQRGRENARRGREDVHQEHDVDRPAPPNPQEFDDSVLAAAAFNADRTDPGVCWLRYVTVDRERRGEGLGPKLAAFVAERALDRGFRRLRIAVNNPFAYEAMYKAGFVYTGRQTGLAELVLERPGLRDRATYQCGLDEYRDRELGDPEASFLAERRGAEPPALLKPPSSP